MKSLKQFIEEKFSKNKKLEDKVIGKHDRVPDEKFDAKELAKGIGIEREHTNSKNVAKLIAKDHLSELPDYYTRLNKMEKSAKNDKS